MIIPSSDIANQILKEVAKKIKAYKIKPQLAIYYIGNNEESLSFIKSKQQSATKVGIKTLIIQYKKTPKFITFARELKKLNENPDIKGIVVQLPLPPSLSTDTYISYISKEKDVEGLHPKTTLIPPVALSILTILKYHFLPHSKNNIIWDTEKDLKSLSVQLRNKKIVVIGRGKTGGKPIADTLTKHRIGYLMIHSKTPNPENFLKEANVIISAVGKSILKQEHIKQGALLISVGLHKENDKWVGDYQEKDIKDISSAYTTTPNGVGKLTVAYLLHNLTKLLDK